MADRTPYDGEPYHCAVCGAPVAPSFLIKNLWERSPANAPEQLRQMAADLQKGLSGIGLDLRLVKGAGYQIRDL